MQTQWPARKWLRVTPSTSRRTYGWARSQVRRKLRPAEVGPRIRDTASGGSHAGTGDTSCRGLQVARGRRSSGQWVEVRRPGLALSRTPADVSSVARPLRGLIHTSRGRACGWGGPAGRVQPFRGSTRCPPLSLRRPLELLPRPDPVQGRLLTGGIQHNHWDLTLGLALIIGIGWPEFQRLVP